VAAEFYTAEVAIFELFGSGAGISVLALL